MIQHLVLEKELQCSIVGFHILFDNSFRTLSNEIDVDRAIADETSTPRSLIYVASTFDKLGLVLRYLRLSPKIRIAVFLERSVTTEKVKVLKERFGDYANNITAIFTTSRKIREKFRHSICAPIFVTLAPIDLDTLGALQTPKDNDVLSIASDKHRTPTLFYGSILVVGDNMTEEETEEIVCKLSTTKFILVLDDRLNGDWIQIAAALGCITVGPYTYDEIFYLFPYTIVQSAKQDVLFSHYHAVSTNPTLTHFLGNLSTCKVQRANRYNSQRRIQAISRAHLDSDLHFKEPPKSSHSLIFSKKIISQRKYDNGTFSPQDFVVCCLVKDGIEFAHAWLSHYRKMGARRFFIVDNGSTDGTTDFFDSQQDVSLFKTDLDFKYFEAEIRQYIAETYCQRTWCMTVDIDELFDYPRSSKVDFHSFIRYLNIHKFTAVTATMIDMFNPQKALSGNKEFTQKDVFYDLSNIRKNDYENLRNSNYKYNACGEKGLKFFYGGIRAHDVTDLSKTKPVLLLKHPLTFQDGNLIPQIDPHFCDRAHVADVSCILKHYKLAEFNKELTLNRAQAGIFNYFANHEYQNYLDSHAQYGELYHSTDPRELRSTDELNNAGIMYMSARYISYTYQLK